MLLADDTGVRYGAKRTLMTGNSGICRVYVDNLDHPDERDQQNAEQRKHSKECSLPLDLLTQSHLKTSI